MTAYGMHGYRTRLKALDAMSKQLRLLVVMRKTFHAHVAVWQSGIGIHNWSTWGWEIATEEETP